MTAVKKAPAPENTPPSVNGGNPADVVVEVSATMLSGGASVTVGAGDILQVCVEGTGCIEEREGGGGGGRNRVRVGVC